MVKYFVPQSFHPQAVLQSLVRDGAVRIPLSSTLRINSL
jgi:hypothetical protein